MYQFESLEERRLLAVNLGALPSAFPTSIPVDKTLQVPITTTSASNVSFVLNSSSTSRLTAEIRTGTWIEMNVAGFGDMELMLFDDTAPDTIRRITGFIDAGFYDGLSFHRVINDFVAQGGDPAGDGTGGPEERFDDEFSATEIFTGLGQLAMANSGKDTNGSQFFITDGPQRALDFNHTIFGQLVHGFDVLAAITAVATDTNGTPNTPVVITSVNVIENNHDAVMMVTGEGAGSANIQVLATNTDDSTTTTRSYGFTVAADTTDDPVILGPVSNQITAVDSPVSFSLTSTDLEGDAVTYESAVVSGGGNVSVSGNTVTYTPAAGFTGEARVLVGAAQQGATNRGSTAGDPFDKQLITIGVGAAAITSRAGIDVDSAGGVAMDGGRVASFSTSAARSELSALVTWGDGTQNDGFIIDLGNGNYEVLGNHTYADDTDNPLPITVDISSDKGAAATVTSQATVRNFTEVIGGVLFIYTTSGEDIITATNNGTNYIITAGGKTDSYSVNIGAKAEFQTYAGKDQLRMNDTWPRSYALLGDDDDYAEGGGGDDTLTGGGGKNTVIGGAGNDRLNGSGGRDFLKGAAGDDRLYGNGGNDTLDGGGGVDRLFGFDGDDLLIGGGSNDKLFGGIGDDILYGKEGFDILRGEAGNDTAYLEGDNDTTTGVENIIP